MRDTIRSTLGEHALAESKRIPVSFRVSPRFKRCLELAAEHEQRSQTNLIEKLLFDFCKSIGIDPSEVAEGEAVVEPTKKA